MNHIDFPAGRRSDARPVADLTLAHESASPETERMAATPLIIQFVSVARRRKWLILTAIVGALLLGIVGTILVTPKYTASATIEIQREGNTLQAVQTNDTRAANVDLEFYETQYGLLQSQNLAEHVVTNLRLENNAHFFAISGGPKTWFVNGKLAPGASTRDQRLRVAATMLLAHLQVRPQRQSRLVELRYTSPDPALAQQVVNAWGTAFIQTTLDRRYEASSYARQFLEQRLAQLRQRIDTSERQLVDYARQQGIVNLPAVSGGNGQPATGERSLMVEDLSALNTELAGATADRIKAESRLNTPGGQALEGLQNSAISAFRQQRTELAANYAKLMVQFEPAYPPARAIQGQIAQLDAAIAREENRVGATLRQSYEASLAREKNLRSRVQALTMGVLDFRRRSIQYNIIQRDADTNRQLYDALLQRYKEIGVAGGVGVNNIAVVDSAEVPTTPSSPNLILNLAIALLAGFAIGIGGALLLEQIDQGISDPKDVENELALPLLGTIPRNMEGNVVSILRDRKSALYEAYLSLRTNLGFTTSHGLPRTLAVTSSRPAEGKSISCYALAWSIAQNNARVLLLDADMRSPSVHHELDMQNEKGLSNYLAGDTVLADLIHATMLPNLFVMTAGPLPPSAPELLAGSRLGELLRELLQTFDHVIVDSPPVLGLADAPLIGGNVEGIVFVIESHATQKAVMRTAVERLRAAQVPLLGAVLTKFDQRRAHYGYGYSYGYEYEYGTSKPGTAAER